MRLRVATFNIRNGRAWDGRNSWPFRRRSTAAVVQQLGADVLGLQEVLRCQLRWLGRQLPSYDAVGAGRSHRRRGEHCPVLVRHGLRVARETTQWFGDSPTVPGSRLPGASFPRIFTTATIDVAAGRLVQVTSTHLDERSAENRRVAVDQLLGALDRRLPQILVGDLNAAPDDPVLEQLDGLVAVVPQPPLGTNHDFTGRTDGRRIDHIFVSDDFTVVAAEVVLATPGGRLPSDHWPVVADVELRG